MGIIKTIRKKLCKSDVNCDSENLEGVIMTYWEYIKQTTSKLKQEFEVLRILQNQVVAEVDKSEAILPVIQHFLDCNSGNREPAKYAMSIIIHYLWHFNHCLMFYIALSYGNYSGATIFLRAIFDNFASLILIISDTSSDHRFADLFFEHLIADETVRNKQWYRQIERYPNFYELCENLDEFSQTQYNYSLRDSYTRLFKSGSKHIHPSGEWTGQWLKYIESEKRFVIMYQIEKDYFDKMASDVLEIIIVINEIVEETFKQDSQ